MIGDLEARRMSSPLANFESVECPRAAWSCNPGTYDKKAPSRALIDREKSLACASINKEK
eukprot:1862209-Pyramimonas_sp.AAC.1